ncbi:PIN domain-containing protein [Candidatus Thorarchaeota archaeon]|nr:MAG: PIN domain-containing protein [Candidatus Thorarchaeota archaeon]
MNNNQRVQRILLDTSFLLPTLGVEVEHEVMEVIPRLNHEEVQLFYSHWSLLESSWFATKQIKQDTYQKTRFRRGLLSITKTGHYNAVSTGPDDYMIALDLFQMGHSDMIDNLLYATALRNQQQFLTIDTEFSKFVAKNEIEDVLLFPKEL